MNCVKTKINMALRSTQAAVFATAVLAFVVSLFMAQHAFLGRPITTDENSYVFQATQLASGRLAYPYPDIASIFHHEMIILHRLRGWFSRYPPGHALWLVPGVWLGNPRIMIALAAGLTVLVLAFAAKLTGVAAWLPGLLMVLSPFFIFGHGTLLSHTSGALASSLIIAGMFLWVIRQSLPGAGLAGLAWAWLFMNRSLSALALVPVIGLWALCYLFSAGRFRQGKVWQGTVLLAVTAALGVLAYLFYNYRMTGDPLLPTYIMYAPSEGIGFGWRYTHVQGVYHTWQRGLSETWQNLVLLDRWLLGWTGSLLFALLLALAGMWVWPHATGWLLPGFIAVVFGYVFFWYPGPREFGPGYYLEAAPFLYMAAAAGIWNLHPLAGRLSKVQRILAGIVITGLWLFFMQGFCREQVLVRNEAAHREAELAAVLATAPPDSLVILRNIPQPERGQLVLNPHGLQSDPLVVRDNPDMHHLIARRFPERNYFYLQPGAKQLLPVKLSAAPRRVCIAPVITRYFTGGNRRFDEDSFLVRVADNAAGDEAGYLAFGGTFWLAPGTNRIDFMVSAENTGWASSVDFASYYGKLVHAQSDIPDGLDQVVTLVVVNDEYWQVEPRVYYGGAGRLEVHNICLGEVIPGEWVTGKE